jgi:hypothetical protein
MVIPTKFGVCGRSKIFQYEIPYNLIGIIFMLNETYRLRGEI